MVLRSGKCPVALHHVTLHACATAMAMLHLARGASTKLLARSGSSTNA